MALLNLHRALKHVKLFLVSPLLQQILIYMQLLVYPLNELGKGLSTSSEISVSEVRDLFKFSTFMSLTSKDDYYSFLQTTILPRIYVDYPTRLYLFTPPTIYQSVSSDGSASSSTSLPCIESLLTSPTISCAASTSLNALELAMISKIFSRESSTFTSDCTSQSTITSHSTCEYSIVFGRSNYTSILQSMSVHGWLGTETTYSVFEVSWRNIASSTNNNNYVYIRFLLEMDSSSGEILSKEAHFANVKLTDEIIEIGLLVFLFMLNILYTFKMFMEFNLIIEKWTFVGHIVNIAVAWLYTVVTMLLQILAQKLQHPTNDIPTFSLVYEYDQMQKTQAVAALVIFAILPFRFFTWVTQFRFFRWVKKFSNIIFKTFPGMFTTFLTLGITFFFAVGANYSNLYSDVTLVQTRTTTSLLSMFDTNIMEAADLAFRDIEIVPSKFIFPAISTAIHSLLFIYIASFFSDLLRRATPYEFKDKTTYQEEFSELVADLDSKVESTKNVIKGLIEKEETEKSNKSRERILLYFSLKSDAEILETGGTHIERETSAAEAEVLQEISIACSESNVIVRKFEDLSQMIQFIVCLTTIRTEYFSHNSGEKFRILFYLENSREFFKTTNSSASNMNANNNNQSNSNQTHSNHLSNNNHINQVGGSISNNNNEINNNQNPSKPQAVQGSNSSNINTKNNSNSNNTNSYSSHNANATTGNCINQLNGFLDVLQQKGCNYPVLYFTPNTAKSSSPLSHAIQVALRSVYHLSIATNRADILYKFCGMQIPFARLEDLLYLHPEPLEPVKQQQQLQQNQQLQQSIQYQQQQQQLFEQKKQNGFGAASLPPLRTTGRHLSNSTSLVGSKQANQMQQQQYQQQQSQLQQQQQQIQGQQQQYRQFQDVNYIPQNTINTYKSFNSQESKDLSSSVS